jgi:hypothetical protein
VLDASSHLPSDAFHRLNIAPSENVTRIWHLLQRRF